MITSFTPKKSFCFFWGRSMGVSVTSITVTTGISAWFSRAFFPFKRKFPDCQSIFSVLFTIRPIVDSDSWPLVPMWKYVLYCRQYSNVTKTCSSLDSLGFSPLLDGFGRETSAWAFVERSAERWIRFSFNTFYWFYHLSVGLFIHTETAFELFIW